MSPETSAILAAACHGVSALRTCLHPFIFAAYPVLLVAGANAGVLPLDAWIIVRCVAVSSALAALCLIGLRPLVADLAARAALSSFVFIGFSLYAWVGGSSTALLPSALYTLACAGGAVLIVRPWQSKPRTSTPLNAAAVVLLAANVYSCLPALTGMDDAAAAALAGEATRPITPVQVQTRPDIYYIVLDGFGRADVVRERFGLDLAPLVQALRADGFIVPERGRSNYAQTYLSLASSLNLTYLGPVDAGRETSRDRRRLDRLIQQNAMMRLAKEAGYRTIAIGSDYSATEGIASADECLCDRYGLHEIEAAALNLTPARALVPERLTYAAHRAKVEAAFEHLRTVAGRPGPKLVFAHVLAPHPPFVFRADGSPRPAPRRVYELTDGHQFGGSREEYVEGYREQATYVARRLRQVVRIILERGGESPVILVHGDHGPASMRDPRFASRESARERMAIFSAYRLPGPGRPELAADVSPVNAVRMTATRYLGASLPPVPDVSFVSGWERPFEFVRVEPDGTPSEAAPRLSRR